MSLKLDNKLMKVADEFADFDIMKPKDPPGPHFRTQETDSIFILNVQLKGYKRTNIKVERNKDASRITIFGEKPVQDILMVGGKVVKKDIEMHGFRKSFKVPQGVVVDKIKARFNEDNSELIVRIPKATKGFTYTGIQELKTKDVLPESTEMLHVYANGESSEPEIKEENIQDFSKKVKEQDKEKSEEERDGNNHAGSEEDDKEPILPKRGFKICTPVIFGSTFFVSLIVLVFHLVQSKKPVKEQKKTDQD